MAVVVVVVGCNVVSGVGCVAGDGGNMVVSGDSANVVSDGSDSCVSGDCGDDDNFMVYWLLYLHSWFFLLAL